MTENENSRLFLVKQTSLNLERMLPMMNMWMKWPMPQLASKGVKKKKKKETKLVNLFFVHHNAVK